MTKREPFRFGRLGRHGVIYGMGIMLNKAVAFIMLPVYTRFLTPSDYGLLQLADMAIEVLSIAAGSRIAAGIFHFYHKAETEEEKRSVLSTSLLILTVSFVLVSATAYLGASGIAHVILGSEEYAGLVRLATARMAFTSFIIVPLASLQIQDRSGMYVLANALRLVLQLGFNILFVVVLGRGAEGVLLSGLIGTSVVGTGLALLFMRDTGFHPSRRAAADILRFGFPFLATQLATFIMTFSDRYFLREAADTSAVGLYGLAYQFGFLLSSVAYVPFNTVWEPIRFEIAKRSDRDTIYARVFVYFNLIMVTTAMAIALFVYDGLRIIADPAFVPAAGVVPIILVAYVLQGWTGVHNIGLFYKERPGLIMWANWVAAVVAIIGYVLLIPHWLGYGAAITTVVAFAVREVMIYGFSQHLWPVQYAWTPVLRLTLAAGAVYLIHWMVPIPNLWRSLVLQTALFLGFLVIIWYGGVLSRSDRQAFLKVIRSPRDGVAAMLKGD